MRRFGLSLGLMMAVSPAWALDLSLAQKHLERAEYAEAEKELGASSATEDGATALLRARLELERGRYAEAEQVAKRAAKSKIHKAEAHAVLGESLWLRGKSEEAIAALREVEQEPDARKARLLLGEYLILSGKRGDARAPLMTLIADYNNDAIKNSDADGLTLVGRAAHLLRSARDANDAYNDAEKAGGKKRVDTLLSRGELFLDKYDPGHAGLVVKEALELAPNHPRARVLRAEVLLDNAMDFAGAEAEIELALKQNPVISGAFFVRAGLALRTMDIEAADRALDQGLRTNPKDLELLSMKAATRFLADDTEGFRRIEKQVLSQNPEYSEFYAIVSEYAEWEHRYDDIIKLMETAVTIDPRDAKAYAQLGLNLIRAGREDEGVAALKKAWEKDRFNVRVFNTLNLYERDIENGYLTVGGQVFRMRYAKDEKAILERYVPRMLDEAWGSMVKRYKFTPQTPVSIELYAEEEHFSVRTSGLPNVGIQGVCFGQTLALLSPRAAPFNWGNVLWHELGHVFAIQFSKNHVPRWYTEGLSEYETIIQRPEWRREDDARLHAALKANRVPQVLDFNKAFTHVDSVQDVTMAYYAASQLVVFMVERYGWEKVVSMMPRWGKGERSPEVIAASLGIDAKVLDQEFRAWLSKRLSRYDDQIQLDLRPKPLDVAEQEAKSQPKSAQAQSRLALSRLAGGKADQAGAAIGEALRLDPQEPLALYLRAELALGDEKVDPKVSRPQARADLEKIVAGKRDNLEVRLKLAELALADEDLSAAEVQLQRAHLLDPSQAEPLGLLIGLAQKRGDERTEIELLKKYVILEQHDRAAWGRLLRGLVARFRWEEAVTVGEGAMFVDVANPEVHRLYARALANSGRHLSAIYEYNSAIVSGAPPEMAVEVYGELAKAYEAQKQPKLAEQARAFQQKASQRVKSKPGDKPGR